MRRAAVDLHEFDRIAVRIMQPVLQVIVQTACWLTRNRQTTSLQLFERCSHIVNEQAEMLVANRAPRVFTLSSWKEFNELRWRDLNIDNPWRGCAFPIQPKCLTKPEHSTVEVKGLLKGGDAKGQVSQS